jgi:hypothetical protein
MDHVSQYKRQTYHQNPTRRHEPREYWDKARTIWNARHSDVLDEEVCGGDCGDKAYEPNEVHCLFPFL